MTGCKQIFFGSFFLAQPGPGTDFRKYLFSAYISRMTLYEFNALGAEEKAAFAMLGNFVDTRAEGGLKVALYSHPLFYAEVFYDGLTNAVTRCRAFTSLTPLAAYIHLN